MLYTLLAERLSGTTVLSIGHRGALAAFHGGRVVVPGLDGAVSTQIDGRIVVRSSDRGALG